MDIFEKCHFPQIDEAIQQGYYPYFQTISEKSGPVVNINGESLIMAGSNDYLGLSTDTRLIEAAKDANSRFGTTCSGSRLLNGTLSLHEELEEKLASFLKKEKVLVVTTGYSANLTALSALLGRNDVAVADRLNHASLVDGIRLGHGKYLRYRHHDDQECETILSKIEPSNGILLVSDGVFSMEGDLADLPTLVRLKKRFGARIFLDDAHGIGVMGANGRGTAEHFDLEDEMDILTGTFSKSFGSLGGFIAGPASVIDYLKHTATPFIFSASMTPAAAASILQALRIIQQEPERRHRLLGYAQKVRKELKKLGLLLYEGLTPIIAIQTNDDDITFSYWKHTLTKGVFVNPVVSPAVPKGKQLIRMCLMATHTEEHIEQILNACEYAGKMSGLIK